MSPLRHITSVFALYSVEVDSPVTRKIARVFLAEDAEFGRRVLADETACGRLVNFHEITGESAEFAHRLHEEAVDAMFGHPCYLDPQTTESGRAMLAARERLHNFLCT